MPHWTDLFSFARGVVRSREVGYLVLSNDELAEKKIPHSIPVVWHKGNWLRADKPQYDWLTAATVVVRQPKEQLCAVGEYGQVLVMGSGDTHEEKIGTGKDSPDGRGPLRGARTIGKEVIVVGMDRQVYKREALNTWVPFDQGARPKAGSKKIVGFESVDGFSSKELYAVGWDGEIWRCDGKKWSAVDSPTNAVLTQVCCAGDGNAYACGRRGLLLRGKKDSWEVLEHESTTEDLWDLCWFDEHLYLSSTRSLFTLEGDQLKPVKFGKDVPETCGRLSAADGVLWSIGGKDVMAFDGKKWTRID